MTAIGSSGAPPGGEKQPSRVVVGIDGSEGARGALRAALVEAAVRGAELEVVSVYPIALGWSAGRPLAVPDIDAVRADTRDRARALLAEARGEMIGTGVPGIADVPARVVIDGGQAAAILVERAAAADLLVVGSRGRSPVRSVLLGSVALHCVTHASCPVVVAHGRPEAALDRGRHVAVGLDGSDGALVAVREAVGQALRRGTDLDVVVAHSLADFWADPYSFFGPAIEELPARLAEEAERLVGTVTAELSEAGSAVPAVHVHVVEGSAREVLVEHTADVAMLVVGSRGHGAFRGLLLGSVALHCVTHAHCPVTVVHPEDRLTLVGRVAQPHSARA